MSTPVASRRLAAVCLAVSATVSLAAPTSVDETFPSGKPKGKYQTNESGERDGPFTEFFDGGKTRAKGTYKAGHLDGTRTEFYPTGKVLAVSKFKAGALDGAYTENGPAGTPRLTAVYKDGELKSLKLLAGGRPVFTQEFDGPDWRPKRRLAEVVLAIDAATTAPPPAKKVDPVHADRQTALRKLAAYRAAVGLPFDDLVLDDDMNKAAATGAELCEALGRLDHTPKNTVGWPDDKFQLGYKGTSHSNLAMNSSKAIVASVDQYMNDSDAGNIDRVGHRRWCLNPTMLKTGFGASPNGKYAAMWSFDKSRTPVPDYDFVTYPPAGFAPSTYFKPRYAWSFSPNPKTYKFLPSDNVSVKVYRKTDGKPTPHGTEVKLDYTNLESGGFGSGPCLIFRPEKCLTDEGSAYVVVIDGLTTTAGETVKVSYLVVFVAV